MKKNNKAVPEDDNFVWVGDPETGRWVTIDEYNNALLSVGRGTFSSVDMYFRFIANYNSQKDRIDVI